jgi:hypothetical protein
MDSSTTKKAIITAVVTIIVTVIVYSVIGSLSYLNNTVIYDETPTKFSCNPYNPEWTLNVHVRNKAPLTFPLINPFYSVTANVNGDNNTFAYFTGLGDTPRNFTDWSLDIGRIDAGNEETASIILHVGEGNFSITVNVWLNFMGSWKAASATYFIEYEGNFNYTITRPD